MNISEQNKMLKTIDSRLEIGTIYKRLWTYGHDGRFQIIGIQRGHWGMQVQVNYITKANKLHKSRGTETKNIRTFESLEPDEDGKINIIIEGTFPIILPENVTKQRSSGDWKKIFRSFNVNVKMTPAMKNIDVHIAKGTKITFNNIEFEAVKLKITTSNDNREETFYNIISAVTGLSNKAIEDKIALIFLK
jgi:hypothetical protein